jgi:AraC-like DNA-binding protein
MKLNKNERRQTLFPQVWKQSPDFLVKSDASKHLTAPTFINGFNNQYHVEVDEGWLSLKSMWHGPAVYTVANGRITVDDNHYLILNDRQPYVMQIEQATAVESFCVFFPAKWAGDVLRNFILPDDQLLEERGGETAVSFYDVLNRHDQLVTPILQTLRQARKQNDVDEGWQTEILHQLLAAMLQVQRQVHQEAAKLPAARTTTRKELYRRLQIGRDFMRDNLQTAVSLEEVAQVAALSPYHFLRSFKQLFGQTPHAYLTAQRLKRAQQLLAHSDVPITDICLAVGFQSLGSFSALFQRHNGRSPRQFRQQFSK